MLDGQLVTRLGRRLACSERRLLQTWQCSQLTAFSVPLVFDQLLLRSRALQRTFPNLNELNPYLIQYQCEA